MFGFNSFFSEEKQEPQAETNDERTMSEMMTPEQWSNAYKDAQQKKNLTGMHNLLTGIFEDTVEIVNRGWYISPAGKRVTLPSSLQMERDTVFYSHELPPVAKRRDEVKTEVHVVKSDSIDAAKLLLDNGLNPVVLNMANRRTPGGGVQYGARAQEETLVRRSSLFRSLFQFASFPHDFGVPRRPESYPMDRNFGGIYTPNAVVFREGLALGYRLMETPFLLSFVAVAAINRPRLDENGWMTQESIDGTLNKIRTMFRIARRHNHDSIVLGAWGCGAFKNPPEQIAKLFHQVLEEEEFRNQFTCEVFAILENHHTGESHNPRGNFLPFSEEFTLDYSSMSPEELENAINEGDTEAAFTLGRQELKNAVSKRDKLDAIALIEAAAKNDNAHAQTFMGSLYMKGEHLEQDAVQAVRWFQKAAENHDDWGALFLADAYFNGNGVEQDDRQAFQLYQFAAKNGIPPAQYKLGLCFLHGIGTAQNLKQAFDWFSRAAKNGDTDAMTDLGECYGRGIGTQQNETLMLKWLNKAAENGSAKAECILGDYDCYGPGQNPERAVQHYQKAAEMGDSIALFSLGNCYQTGCGGLEKSLTKAISLWQQALEADVSTAALKLAECYANGTGVEKSPERAFELYRKAMDLGEPDAAYQVALCLMNGTGTEQNYKEGRALMSHLAASGCDPAHAWVVRAAEAGDVEAFTDMAACLRTNFYFGCPDLKQAAKWERKAAEAGNASAMFNLSVAYNRGDGVKQSPQESLRYLKMAAEKGDPSAETGLAQYFLKGNYPGVPQDIQQAVKLFTRAAEKGHPVAEGELGTIYELGNGVEKDESKAAEFYQKSMDGGCTSSISNLARLYAEGRGVEQNRDKAFRLFNEGAAKGDPIAIYYLGQCYEFGDGVQQDYQKAFYCFEDSAKCGFTPALHKLAQLLLSDKLGRPNEEKALKYLRQAAKQQFEPSIELLKELGR